MKNKKKEYIVVTNHTAMRWNQRIKRNVSRKAIEKYIFNGIIEPYFEDFYLLNDDIVLKLEVIEKPKYITIRVITTYGKISETPALNNLKAFIKEKRKYGKMCRKIY